MPARRPQGKRDARPLSRARRLRALAPRVLSRAVVFACFVCGAAAAGGCAGARPSCRIPDTVQLEIESSDRLNPDDDGRSLPTILRLYQLKDLSKLEQAAFEDVWQHDKQALGETLVGSQELTLYPGQVMVHRFQRNGEADYLVGMAVFRQPVGGSWRTIQEWPLPGDPCAEQDDEHAAPKLKKLRLRMFLENYRIDSVNNYAALPKRHCAAGAKCGSGGAPDELPEARRNGRLKTFEEDPNEAVPTMGTGAATEDQ